MIQIFLRIIPFLVVFLLMIALHLAYSQPGRQVQRFGSVVFLRPEKVVEYRHLHSKVWPVVLNRLRSCNIRNYSIYLKETEPGKFYLFSYYEYIGADYSHDMAVLAADPEIKAWWKLTDPCQAPVPKRKQGELWAGMEEVFHME
jgi:L-rhamnose mutarotase